MTRGNIPALIFAFAFSFVAIACSDDTEPPADSGPDAMDQFIRETSPDIDDVSVPDGLKDDSVPDIGELPDADTCALSIFKINNQDPPTEVTILDDQDANTAGLQLKVAVFAGAVAAGKTVKLTVAGASDTATTNASGLAEFTITVDDTKAATLQFDATATGCAAATSVFVSLAATPKCNFTAPGEGATLTAADDEVMSNGQYNKTIELQTTNAVGGIVEATYVGGASLGPLTVPAGGKVSYVKQALTITPGATSTIELAANVEKTTSGGAKLTAACTSTDLTSPTLTFSVDTEAPSCVASIPNLQSISSGFGLGPAQNASTGQPGFWIEINVTTTNGKQVTISPTLERVGGALGQYSPPSKTVSNGQATFLVELKDGDGVYNVQVDCEDVATSNLGKSSISKFTLDTLKPDAPANLTCSVDTTVSNHRKGILSCTWPQPNDPGTAPSGVEQYDIRCAPNAAVDPNDFDNAGYIKLDGIPAFPLPNNQAVDVSGLSIPNAYSCAVRARDVLGNVSDVSNVTPQVKFEYQVQELLGSATGLAFGFPVVAGDFNCDGLVDIAVGLNAANNKKGEVLLFFSGGAGFPTMPSKRLSGTIANAGFGIGLAALNFDGDAQGCDDLAVYAVGNGGSVYLYLGRPVWQDRSDVEMNKGAELIYRRPAGTTGELLGLALAGLDMNGDGRADLAMTNIVFGGTSRVYVDFGETVTLMGPGVSPTIREMPTAADVTIQAGTSGAADLFGLPLGNGGRLDADTTDELLIGARNTRIAAQKRGAVYVIKGSTTGTGTIDVTTTNARTVRINGGSSNLSFGRSVAGVGDLNKDGVREFAVSDNEITVNGRTNAGAVYIFNLQPTIPATVTDAAAVIENDRAGAENDEFGIVVASSIRVSGDGADLDKDTYADMLIGLKQDGTTMSGVGKLFHGKAGALTGIAPQGVNSAKTTLMRANATQFNSFISLLIADTNGDTYADFIITDYQFSSSTGRVLVHN